MHAYPLRSLELKNFKSIADGAVEFKPLTVLVGMNSSGKSSLLQAIRFLSQTAQAHEVGVEVPLNDTKIRLGAFDDVRTVGSDGQVSFQAALMADRNEDPGGNGGQPQALLTLGVAEPDTKPDRGYATITVNELKVSGTPILFCAERWLNAVWSHVELAWIDTWDPILANDPAIWDDIIKDDMTWDDTYQLRRALEESSGAERAVNQTDKSLVQAGVDDIRRAFAGTDLRTSSEFMPDFWNSVTSIEDEATMKAIIGFLFSKPLPSSDDESQPEPLDEASQETLVSLIRNEFGASRTLAATFVESAPQHSGADINKFLIRSFYEARDAQLDAASVSCGIPSSQNSDRLKRVIDVIEERARLLLDSEWAAMALSMIEVGGLRFVDDPEFDDEEPDRWPKTDTFKIAQLFAKECLDDEWAKDPALVLRANRHLAGKWRRAVAGMLQDRVRYLGPLRQEPRPYFDFGDDSRHDVGAAGEHLSQVLQWHGTKSVDVPGLGNADLTAGLQYWLRQLEVVEDVAVEARGRAGVSIEVRPTDLDRRVDLTSVGVGVSQVLPVLTVCLLAEPGDVVLLEQPELHLHPVLQMRLADFLLACVDSGRQIIVETHSEHLVNRLRRRVAEDGSNDVGELVRIVFAERGAEGHTVFRSSDVNPLGGLSEDWPDGFLDLGARDAQKLLQAGLAKHRRLSNA
jgi:predicted ATPase